MKPSFLISLGYWIAIFVKLFGAGLQGISWAVLLFPLWIIPVFVLYIIVLVGIAALDDVIVKR